MDNSVLNKYIIKIKSDLNFLETLEKFLLEVCFLRNVPKTLYKKIFLCVSEGVSNAIVHGNKCQDSKFVNLEITLKKNVCEVQIEDEGEGFNYQNLPNPTSEENRTRESGRGLYIIRMYSDEFSFLNNGSIIKMKFILNE